MEGEEEETVESEESVEVAQTDTKHVADGWEADIDDLDLPSIPKVRLVLNLCNFYNYTVCGRTFKPAHEAARQYVGGDMG